MKKLLSLVFAMALGASFLPGQHHPESVNLGGAWQMTMDSPHGPLKGPFKVEQDGSKLTATYQTEMLGTVRFDGTIEGKNVSFEVAGGEITFKLKGTVDGDQMSGTTSLHDGAWKATRQ